jgi:hypothetical protein
VSNFLPLNIFGWGDFRRMMHMVNTNLRQICRSIPTSGGGGDANIRIIHACIGPAPDGTFACGGEDDE